jgi:hypothetical protein
LRHRRHHQRQQLRNHLHSQHQTKTEQPDQSAAAAATHLVLQQGHQPARSKAATELATVHLYGSRPHSSSSSSSSPPHPRPACPGSSWRLCRM